MKTMYRVEFDSPNVNVTSVEVIKETKRMVYMDGRMERKVTNTTAWFNRKDEAQEFALPYALAYLKGGRLRLEALEAQYKRFAPVIIAESDR